MNTILVIDDELIDPDNTRRKDIENFGDGYGYKIMFIEAPDPEELRDKKKLKDKISRNKPAAIFLDIVHKGKQYNVASLLRTVIGHEIPILILTNYTKKDLEEENKRFIKMGQDLKEKASFIEQSIKKIEETIKDNNLKREVRVPLSGNLMRFRKLKEIVQDYKNGISDKSSLLNAIRILIKDHSEDKNLVDSLKKLKAFLWISSMPDYFGSKYPTDFRQIIGYVLKDNFIDMQEQIDNGIATSTNPDNSVFSLDVSTPSIRIQDSEGNTVGAIREDNATCEQLKKFADSSDLCRQIPAEIDKARKIVSDINNSIYEATKWKLRDVLKNTGSGKYKLDIGRFIVNGVVIKDFQKTSQPPDVSKQIDKVLSILNNLTGKMEGLEKRVQRLENRSPKE